MEPNTVGRNSAQRVIDRFDMLGDHAAVVVERFVAELSAIPAHRQTGIIQLDHQACIDDRAVFVGERFGRGEHEGLVGWVMVVLEVEPDLAG